MYRDGRAASAGPEKAAGDGVGRKLRAMERGGGCLRRRWSMAASGPV
jgi:hypothetical protein